LNYDTIPALSEKEELLAYGEEGPRGKDERAPFLLALLFFGDYYSEDILIP